MTSFHIAVPLVAAGLLVAGPALAHPKLLSSSPKAGVAASATDHVSLTFSEPLVLALSKISLSAGGKAVAAKGQALSADGKTLTASFDHALAAGTYEAGWTVVSTDTHKVAGKFGFTVK
jgi:methionine-rich copper-binding protein CopC